MPITSFAAVLRGRESPPNGLQLGKRTRGMFGQRVVGEGMEKGNGESITANAMTKRPQISPKLISAQRLLHIAEKKYACTHMLRSACAHPPSSPYALTCLHAPATASVVLSANNGNQRWACATIHEFRQERCAYCTHRAKHARVDCTWITRGIAM